MTTRQEVQAVLVYEDIEGSQQYLVKTFGFVPGELHRAPDGTAVHGEVTVGSTAIWMHRVTHEHGLDSPKNLGYASGQLVVYVDDVDAHHQRVTAAGGHPTTPTNQAYGLRDYSVFDNEGHLWTFASCL
ncbi:MAG TPA: VOC family protein [Acidimicrobiales bacterium]|nr:VOC family protein [Acidimicrobiales bacterium]